MESKNKYTIFLLFCLTDSVWLFLELILWYSVPIGYVKTYNFQDAFIEVLPLLTRRDLPVQFSHSVTSDSATPWTAALQASLPFTISQSLLKLISIESVMPSNHLIFCHPLLLPPSIFPSIWVFSNESVLCIRWPKYWSFAIIPSNEYSGLISFRDFFRIHLKE